MAQIEHLLKVLIDKSKSSSVRDNEKIRTAEEGGIV